MEILSASDDADNKPAKRAPNAPEPLRSFRLPSLETPVPAPRPPEQSVAKSVQVPEGVLWVSHHPEQEQHRAAIEADDKDKDDDTTKKKKQVTTGVVPSTEQHEIPIEATILQPPQETTTHPHPTAEAHSLAEEADTPVPTHEIFAYPETPLDTEWSPATTPTEQLPEHYAVEDEPFASPEPLPPIAGFESHEPYEPHAVEVADEEEPAPIPVPLPRRPLQSPVHASTGSPQSPNYGAMPNFNAAPNTPPPPPANTGPGGGGPPTPPSYPPGGASFNMPPSGGSGNFNAMPTAANPNVAPALNPNLAPGYAPNRPVRNADWVARVVGVGAWLRAGSVKKKLNRRIDKFEGRNERDHKKLADEHLRFSQEQRGQDKEINRLRLEQRRQSDERQRVQQRFETPLAAPQTVTPEQPQEQGQTLQEQAAAELRPDERVVQDAWYRSVIKDGHVVRDAIQYGESFQKEQQKEAIQDRTAATATVGGGASASQAGGNANVQMAGGGQPTFYSNNTQPSAVPAPMSYQVSQTQQLPSGMTGPALPPGVPTHLDTAHQLPAHTETKRTVSGLAFWVMLAIIIVAFFVAALI
jgi:hypothetical protein